MPHWTSSKTMFAAVRPDHGRSIPVSSIIVRSRFFSSNLSRLIPLRYGIAMSTRLSLCLSVHISRKPRGRTSPVFGGRWLWPWISHRLTDLWCTTYFRFCGCRVFTQWSLRCILCNSRNYASIPAKFRSTTKISKYTLLHGCVPGSKSVIYDCTVTFMLLNPLMHKVAKMVT